MGETKSGKEIDEFSFKSNHIFKINWHQNHVCEKNEMLKVSNVDFSFGANFFVHMYYKINTNIEETTYANSYDSRKSYISFS